MEPTATVLGGSLGNAGDVNGDGFDDVVASAVGSQAHGFQTGSVLVYSGLDGSVLYDLDGDAAGDLLGRIG